MAFWNKDPGFGVESVETIQEIIRDGRKDHPLFEDLYVEPLTDQASDVLAKAGLFQRPWTCLFVFHLKAQRLALKLEERKPIDEAKIMKNPFDIRNWKVPSFKWFRIVGIGRDEQMIPREPTPSELERNRLHELAQAEVHKAWEEERRVRKEEQARQQAIAAEKIRHEARSKGFTSLTVKEQTKLGAGSYGSYIKIDDDFGVKVLRDFQVSFIEQVNLGHENILREFNGQRQAHEACGSLVPNVIAIVPVEMNGYWYPGIVMEHVEGQPLAVWADAISPGNDEINVARYRALVQTGLHSTNEYMKRLGVVKPDHHEHNVLVDRNGFYRVIDWGFGIGTNRVAVEFDKIDTMKKAG